MPAPDHMLEVGSGSHAAADRAGDGAPGAGAGRGAPRPGDRPRRRQLDPGGGADRGQDADPRRPHRVGAAQLRPHDARGDQPDRHRPALRPPLPAQRRGDREPARRGHPRGAHALRRQHDDRHPGRPARSASAPQGRRNGSGVEPGEYVLVTLHRPALVDGPLLPRRSSSLAALAREMPVVFPVHPRTRKMLEAIESDHPGLLQLASRSATSTSSRCWPTPAPCSPTPAASRRRRPTSASPASPCATTPSDR